MRKLLALISILLLTFAALGQSSQISFTPAVLDFGKVVSGATSTLNATISNVGSSTVVISNITCPYSMNQVTFTHAAFPITLPPGGNTNIAVTFYCRVVGPQTFKLTFTHNGIGSPTLYVIKVNSYKVPAVSDSVIVTDQLQYTRSLVFGGDPEASDGYDTQFQEFPLPPYPPAGFDIRLLLPEDNFSGVENSWYDFREMNEIPFTGQKEFRIHLQKGVNSPGTKISWQFPSYLTGNLNDLITSTIVDIPMSGTGYVVITDPWIQQLRMLLTYNNSQGPSPVELTTFTAASSNNLVALKWETSTENNNKGFEVERKTLKSNWEALGFINGAGTSTISHSYSYNDKVSAPGSYAYRLKQIDLDGSFSYSKEINVEVYDVNNYTLKQNYPNPFNPSTEIVYTIPESGQVTLKVYNSIGEEVAVLVNEHQDAGKYIKEFSAGNLSSGVYMYKLISGSYVKSLKMLLLR